MPFEFAILHGLNASTSAQNRGAAAFHALSERSAEGLALLLQAFPSQSPNSAVIPECSPSMDVAQSAVLVDDALHVLAALCTAPALTDAQEASRSALLAHFSRSSTLDFMRNRFKVDVLQCGLEVLASMKAKRWKNTAIVPLNIDFIKAVLTTLSRFDRYTPTSPYAATKVTELSFQIMNVVNVVVESGVTQEDPR